MDGTAHDAISLQNDDDTAATLTKNDRNRLSYAYTLLCLTDVTVAGLASHSTDSHLDSLFLSR